MGYPMTYKRFIARNQLYGDYDNFDRNKQLSMRYIVGDLRRVERDTLDKNHVPLYAKYAGVTEDQVRKIFAAFFNDFPRDYLGDYDYSQWEPWPKD